MPNCIDHTKQTATDAVKNASKRVIPKTAETFCDLIDSKIIDKFTTKWTVESETRNTGFDPKKWQQIINDLELL